MKKLSILLIVLFCLTGCAKKGVVIENVQALDDYRVEKIFEVDGVKMYRFVDKARTHYFAVSNDITVINTHKTNNSKNYNLKNYTMYDDNITTLKRKFPNE